MCGLTIIFCFYYYFYVFLTMNLENLKVKKSARQIFNEMGESVCTKQQISLAKELEISESTLRRWLKETGYITIRSRQDEEIIFNDIQNSVIIGSLLGDGTIDKYQFIQGASTNRNSLLRIKHCLKQEEYVKYKSTLLGNLVTSIRYLNNKRLNKEHKAVELTCKRNKAFTKLRDIWYNQGSRQVPDNFELNPLSIAIWFQDNGSLAPSGFSLACQSLTIKSIEILRKKLYDFGIETNTWAGGTIYIPSKSAKDFANLIRIHICNSMTYKLGSH